MSLATEKEALYTEYHDKVSHYVFCRLQNKSDAEDIVSEIFLKVTNISIHLTQVLLPFPHGFIRSHGTP